MTSEGRLIDSNKDDFIQVRIATANIPVKEVEQLLETNVSKIC